MVGVATAQCFPGGLGGGSWLNQIYFQGFLLRGSQNVCRALFIFSLVPTTQGAAAAVDGLIFLMEKIFF